jgi:nucleoside-diphosphate-sugar epimerase
MGRWRGLAAEPNPANPHEAHLLQLDIGKAAARLDWRPRWDFETTVRRTAAGYRRCWPRRMRPPCGVHGDEIAAYEAAS